MKTPVPVRGEIWVVNFNPGRGSEQRGIRPAVILQNDVGNRYASTTIVAAITTTIKPYPVTVTLEKGEGGLNMPSMVNLAQILTVDKSRLERRLGSLSSDRMAAIDEATLVSLGIEL
jgi:mRNA interferase MazF